MTATRKITARESEQLLKHTPMREEGHNAEHKREDEHRSLPKGRQPFLVIFMGIFDYGVLWIGPAGFRGESYMERKARERAAEKEADWWRSKINKGMEVLPFTRDPSPHDVMVRQQWDLDELAAAIQRGYERD